MAVVMELIKTLLYKLFNYKMLGYYVPHSKYPDGYHCNPKDPLPFMNVASQKNSINLYHSGIYAKKEFQNRAFSLR